jgi:carbamoyl-phosphate synthase large subunit
MKSTGEVMGIDTTFAAAFLKSQIGAGSNLPESGTVFVSVKTGDKPIIVPAVKTLIENGFKIVATGGTQAYLTEQGLEVERVNKVAEGQPHIVDRIIDGDIALIFNTTEGWQSLLDSKSIRASALESKVPYYTTATASVAAATAIGAVTASQLEVRSLQDYYS